MLFKELLSKEWFRISCALVVGATVGVLFYPSKKIEEQLNTKYQSNISSLKESHSKETQELNEKYSAVLKQNKELHISLEAKVSQLTDEVKTLKTKQKISTYKLVKPDGTIEERTFTQSEVDESSRVVTKIQQEFKIKVDQIEKKWADIHQERVSKLEKDFSSKETEYKKTIHELEQRKVTTTNEKRFSVELGLTSNSDYYGHAGMDLWGPLFIGLHGQVGNKSKDANLLGVGVGVRF